MRLVERHPQGPDAHRLVLRRSVAVAPSLDEQAHRHGQADRLLGHPKGPARPHPARSLAGLSLRRLARLRTTRRRVVR
eukprot:4270364-Heterocapsa_arctica.AAC.1